MKRLSLIVALTLGTTIFAADERALLSRGDVSVSRASAVIGRPLTPLSYAGVARRTTRRAVAVGAAAGAYGAYRAYPVPGCVQVVDAYGRVVWQCP